MATRKRTARNGATLDDVVEVLGNLLRVVTGQGRTLERHGRILEQHGKELRLHRGLLEHMVEEQRIGRAATELVAQRMDKLAEAILRGRTADLERSQSHELRITRLEQTVFGGSSPPPGVPR